MGLTERRRHPRAPVRGVRAWLRFDGGTREPCRIINVSRKSVLVKTSGLLLPGAIVQLTFARPYGVNVTKVFRRWARVVRSSPYAAAVCFVEAPRGFAPEESA